MGEPENSSITHSQLLAHFMRNHLDIEELIATYKMTPEEFLAFWKDPFVIEVLAAWHQALLLRHDQLAREHQAQTVDIMSQSIMCMRTQTEVRRAGGILTRLTIRMRSPGNPPATLAELNAAAAADAQAARKSTATATSIPNRTAPPRVHPAHDPHTPHTPHAAARPAGPRPPHAATAPYLADSA